MPGHPGPAPWLLAPRLTMIAPGTNEVEGHDGWAACCVRFVIDVGLHSVAGLP